MQSAGSTFAPSAQRSTHSVQKSISLFTLTFSIVKNCQMSKLSKLSKLLKIFTFFKNCKKKQLENCKKVSYFGFLYLSLYCKGFSPCTFNLYSWQISVGGRSTQSLDSLRVEDGVGSQPYVEQPWGTYLTWKLGPHFDKFWSPLQCSRNLQGPASLKIGT